MQLLLRAVLIFASCVVALFVAAVKTGHHHVAVSVLAGAVTGLCETLLMFPLENVKTQQQLKSRSLMVDVVRRTYAVHGIAGFYKGLPPVLVGAIPSQALRWGVFALVCGSTHCASMQDTLVAALVAGVVVSVIVGVPMETLKTESIHRLHGETVCVAKTAPTHRNTEAHEDESGGNSSPLVGSYTLPVNFDQLEGTTPTSTAVGSFQLAETEANGSPRLSPKYFKGMLPTVAKKVLNQAVRFPAHRLALGVMCVAFSGRPALTDQHTKVCAASDHVVLSFFAGAVAGVSSVLVTQPIDVIKTKMQGLQSGRYRHAFHCAAVVMEREGGLSALCDGIVARTLRSSLGAALTFSVFPQVQSWVLQWWHA